MFSLCRLLSALLLNLLWMYFSCQIGLIERVDAIYRATNFGSGYEKQMGFEIKEVITLTIFHTSFIFCIKGSGWSVLFDLLLNIYEIN